MAKKNKAAEAAKKQPQQQQQRNNKTFFARSLTPRECKADIALIRAKVAESALAPASSTSRQAE